MPTPPHHTTTTITILQRTTQPSPGDPSNYKYHHSAGSFCTHFFYIFFRTVHLNLSSFIIKSTTSADLHHHPKDSINETEWQHKPKLHQPLLAYKWLAMHLSSSTTTYFITPQIWFTNFIRTQVS
ncbi:hypothetical protein L6452_44457 [Arctium lappa]|uniref:Uncharacterized protein n=1 Tax=Arctium lappa TaxID=4217 RepID=A0ACB8XFT7_ARCLA|nr:hypothetical protein L6452_44457 [Arctium lappa]